MIYSLNWILYFYWIQNDIDIITWSDCHVTCTVMYPSVCHMTLIVMWPIMWSDLAFVMWPFCDITHIFMWPRLCHVTHINWYCHLTHIVLCPILSCDPYCHVSSVTHCFQEWHTPNTSFPRFIPQTPQTHLRDHCIKKTFTAMACKQDTNRSVFVQKWACHER